MSALTPFLRDALNGNEESCRIVVDRCYAHFCEIADEMLRHERGDSWSVPDLVHETYLRLFRTNHLCVQDRFHFFNVFRREMRRVLVDYSRKQRVRLRFLEDRRVRIGRYGPCAEGPSLEVLDLHAVLEELEAGGEMDRYLAKLIDLRYFRGMEQKEIAGEVRISERTVRRHLMTAECVLRRMLEVMATDHDL